MCFRSADALMIGRAAQGRPWIFREIAHFLASGTLLAPPPTLQVKQWLLEHLDDHYGLYGEYAGVRSARKHIGWTLRGLPGGTEFRDRLNRLEDCAAQVAAVTDWFDVLADMHALLPGPVAVAANDALIRSDLTELAA